MKALLFISTAGFLTIAAAPPAPSGEQAMSITKCGYAIQRANYDPVARPEPLARHEPIMISAVDLKIEGCPVLVNARTGRLIEPPVITSGPARQIPLR